MNSMKTMTTKRKTLKIMVILSTEKTAKSIQIIDVANDFVQVTAHRIRGKNRKEMAQTAGNQRNRHLQFCQALHSLQTHASLSQRSKTRQTRRQCEQTQPPSQLQQQFLIVVRCLRVCPNTNYMLRLFHALIFTRII
uniref:Uncharacterized protein n=1 Tax=Lygus hesperus TaxID=30085 RepID=A0A146LT17_LYGHE